MGGLEIREEKKNLKRGTTCVLCIMGEVQMAFSFSSFVVTEGQ